MSLSNRVAIVTGGGHGIGRAYCLRLAAEGAKVVVVDIDKEGAEAVAKTIQGQGGEAIGIKTDVSDPASTEAMAKKTVEKFGKIDVLVNNAAIFTVHPLSRVPFWEIPLEEWNRVMAVNVTGVFLCTRSVLPYLKAQGKGKIINIASYAGLRGTDPDYLNAIAYNTSKGALITFTKDLAVKGQNMGFTSMRLLPVGLLPK
jgi:NAD(P)-dependent dehydrogenase (short-subunit alcohol dehydrogenase family)